jgi:soluble lytic murein transglycosylase-like protein
VNSAAKFGMALALVAGLCARAARADYAVLKSGLRLHITGYRAEGGNMRLTVEGGEVDVAASDVVAIEPEEQFTSVPFPAPLDPNIPYAGLIRAAANQNGVDEKLVQKMIAAESNFNPRAVSRKQARGLMQLMPQTAARLSVRDVFDPAQNISAGTKYLRELLDKYKGDLKLALAAYNAGPDMVAKYGGIPPFAETQDYVRKILAAVGASKGT